uniref:Uncharacterized protein n=1 Tax=Setaria digitata TaxID=48799 RepID=A0A915Q6Q0_9BILA
MEEKKMIQLLQNRIAYLSDKIEDARDMLFSEVDYHERSFATECENFLKLQSKIKIGKRKCEELGRLIKNYKLQQSLMKKQLEQMNSRIEENKKYSDYLLRRKDRADLLAEYWRNQVAQALQPNVSFSMSPVREIL